LPRLYEQVVFNLVIIVLVLVLVLEIRILWVPRDEDDDEDDLNTLLRETAVAGPTLFLR
jgi:hypothetical protein